VGFVVDTSRNGIDFVRKKWGNWCNLARAGLGERPQPAPLPGIDAYYWIKPPGESDGTGDTTQPNFDEECQSADSMPGAPAAGAWFEKHFLRLVGNATPPI
jgi:cellulase/cellobiase CelA1